MASQAIPLTLIAPPAQGAPGSTLAATAPAQLTNALPATVATQVAHNARRNATLNAPNAPASPAPANVPPNAQPPAQSPAQPVNQIIPHTSGWHTLKLVQQWMSYAVKILGAAAGLVAAYIALSITVWTSAKDFRDDCRSQNATTGILTRDCEEALRQPLSPPPLLSGHLKRDSNLEGGFDQSSECTELLQALQIILYAPEPLLLMFTTASVWVCIAATITFLPEIMRFQTYCSRSLRKFTTSLSVFRFRDIPQESPGQSFWVPTSLAKSTLVRVCPVPDESIAYLWGRLPSQGFPSLKLAMKHISRRERRARIVQWLDLLERLAEKEEIPDQYIFMFIDNAIALSLDHRQLSELEYSETSSMVILPEDDEAGLPSTLTEAENINASTEGGNEPGHRETMSQQQAEAYAIRPDKDPASSRTFETGNTLQDFASVSVNNDSDSEASLQKDRRRKTLSSKQHSMRHSMRAVSGGAQRSSTNASTHSHASVDAPEHSEHQPAPSAYESDNVSTTAVIKAGKATMRDRYEKSLAASINAGQHKVAGPGVGVTASREETSNFAPDRGQEDVVLNSLRSDAPARPPQTAAQPAVQNATPSSARLLASIVPPSEATSSPRAYYTVLRGETPQGNIESQMADQQSPESKRQSWSQRLSRPFKHRIQPKRERESVYSTKRKPRYPELEPQTEYKAAKNFECERERASEEQDRERQYEAAQRTKRDAVLRETEIQRQREAHAHIVDQPAAVIDKSWTSGVPQNSPTSNKPDDSDDDEEPYPSPSGDSLIWGHEKDGQEGPLAAPPSEADDESVHQYWQ